MDSEAFLSEQLNGIDDEEIDHDEVDATRSRFVAQGESMAHAFREQHLKSGEWKEAARYEDEREQAYIDLENQHLFVFDPTKKEWSDKNDELEKSGNEAKLEILKFRILETISQGGRDTSHDPSLTTVNAKQSYNVAEKQFESFEYVHRFEGTKAFLKYETLEKSLKQLDEQKDLYDDNADDHDDIPLFVKARSLPGVKENAGNNLPKTPNEPRKPDSESGWDSFWKSLMQDTKTPKVVEQPKANLLDLFSPIAVDATQSQAIEAEEITQLDVSDSVFNINSQIEATITNSPIQIKSAEQTIISLAKLYNQAAPILVAEQKNNITSTAEQASIVAEQTDAKVTAIETSNISQQIIFIKPAEQVVARQTAKLQINLPQQGRSTDRTADQIIKIDRPIETDNEPATLHESDVNLTAIKEVPENKLEATKMAQPEATFADQAITIEPFINVITKGNVQAVDQKTPGIEIQKDEQVQAESPVIKSELKTELAPITLATETVIVESGVTSNETKAIDVVQINQEPAANKIIERQTITQAQEALTNITKIDRPSVVNAPTEGKASETVKVESAQVPEISFVELLNSATKENYQEVDDATVIDKTEIEAQQPTAQEFSIAPGFSGVIQEEHKIDLTILKAVEKVMANAGNQRLIRRENQDLRAGQAEAFDEEGRAIEITESTVTLEPLVFNDAESENVHVADKALELHAPLPEIKSETNSHDAHVEEIFHEQQNQIITLTRRLETATRQNLVLQENEQNQRQLTNIVHERFIFEQITDQRSQIQIRAEPHQKISKETIPTFIEARQSAPIELSSLAKIVEASNKAKKQKIKFRPRLIKAIHTRSPISLVTDDSQLTNIQTQNSVNQLAFNQS